MKSLGLNPGEQEMIDMTNEVNVNQDIGSDATLEIDATIANIVDNSWLENGNQIEIDT